VCRCCCCSSRMAVRKLLAPGFSSSALEAYLDKVRTMRARFRVRVLELLFC
jgi:cytochrome P450